MEIDVGPGPPGYLVMLRHLVVAQDIAQTIGDHDPSARVAVAATPDEALAALRGMGALRVAFLALGPRALAASRLGREVAARGGRAVLMGEEAEAEGAAAGFAVLGRPFAAAAVLAHLQAPPEGPGAEGR